MFLPAPTINMVIMVRRRKLGKAAMIGWPDPFLLAGHDSTRWVASGLVTLLFLLIICFTKFIFAMMCWLAPFLLGGHDSACGVATASGYLRNQLSNYDGLTKI